MDDLPKVALDSVNAGIEPAIRNSKSNALYNHYVTEPRV